jgi:nitroimidazol reductase NimA-like FMN-containing flavoprotein (pyridoxamine 5'-phosphate oxidase superfamily)
MLDLGGVDVSEMTELSPTECREYLDRGGVGRLAFLTPQGLRIVPLNFCTNADAIVFRTVAGSELGPAIRTRRVIWPLLSQ